MVAIIARMLGWKPPAPPVSELSVDEIAAEAAKFGVPLVRGKDAAMPQPVTDIAEMRERNRRRALEIARRNAAACGGAAPSPHPA